MKKWAKILITIAIVWVIAILIFNSILYFKVQQFSGKGFLDEQDVIAMGSWRGLIETVNANAPFSTIFVYFLKFGIPAWILFIVAGIWGREKNNIPESA